MKAQEATTMPSTRQDPAWILTRESYLCNPTPVISKLAPPCDVSICRVRVRVMYQTFHDVTMFLRIHHGVTTVASWSFRGPFMEPSWSLRDFVQYWQATLQPLNDLSFRYTASMDQSICFTIFHCVCTKTKGPLPKALPHYRPRTNGRTLTGTTVVQHGPGGTYLCCRGRGRKPRYESHTAVSDYAYESSFLLSNNLFVVYSHSAHCAHLRQPPILLVVGWTRGINMPWTILYNFQYVL